MSLNGRLSSLRLARHASRRPLLVVRPQRRCLNEFIHKAPEPDSTPEPGTFRLAVKDNIATHPADGPTTCASAILAGHASPFEATIVAQLKRRGARVVGKTNMDEFGMGGHSVHSAHGPVAQELLLPPQPGTPAAAATVLVSAGGSSGGSALAVAKGLADVALGTDTGGSVRLPAAYCGVVGYKPSYGLLSRYGVVPYANSLDTVGLLARSVGEIRKLVVGRNGLWAEGDPLDPTSVKDRSRGASFTDDAPIDESKATTLLRSLTFGIPAEYNIEELSPPVRSAWHAAATQLAALGARVVPVSLPTTRQALSAYYVLAPAEASSNLAKYDGVRYGRPSPLPHQQQQQQQQAAEHDKEGGRDNGVLYSAVRGASFGAEVQRRILLGAYTLSAAAMDNYFLQAQRVRRLVRRDFDRVFARPNPLVDGAAAQHFDLADMDESVLLADKRGPPQVDVLLCPTAPTLPPTLDEVHKALATDDPTEAYMNDVFTVPASLAGLPAISIPRRVEGDALGRGWMGLQVIGQYWDDARVLAVAEALSVLEK